METKRFQLDALAGWLVAALAALAVLAGGVALRPREVFDQFLWREFVGPVQATALNADCLVLTGWQYTMAPNCAAVAPGTIVATPGLSTVGTIGYGAAFAFLLVGSVLALHRQGLIRGRRFFYAVAPFLFVGGAMLAARDVFASLPDGAVGVLGYPLGLAFAGPVPYFLGVAVPALVLLLSHWLSARGLIARDEHLSVAAAVVLFAGLFAVLALTTLRPGLWLDLLGAAGVFVTVTLLAVVVWAALARLTPNRALRIGSMGLVVFWAYLLNGIATVVRAEWTAELGFKAPAEVGGLVVLVVDLATAVIPADIAAVTRLAWPFIVLQVGVALVVAAGFDRDVVQADELAALLLVTVLAVALVPAVSGLLGLVFGV